MAENLTGKQAKALEGLLLGLSVPDAARYAGTSERTLYRWRQSPLFYAELARRTGEMLDDTTRHMTAVMRGAPGILEEFMHSKDVPPGVVLTATKILLDSTPKLFELNIIKRKLDELEELYATTNR